MKKNIKKRKKWLIPVCIVVVILIMVSGIICYNNNKPIKKENQYNVFVRQYSEVYEPDWELEYVGILSETDIQYAGVKVHFQNITDSWNLDNMAKISYILAPKIRSYMGEEYQSYVLSFVFEGYAGRSFAFRYYDGDKKMISLESMGGYGITLPKIIEAFPDMTSISTDGSIVISFDDLKAIEQLESLQDWWCFSEIMPEKWKEYIWSIFPDCEIRDLSNYWEIEKVPW